MFCIEVGMLPDWSAWIERGSSTRVIRRPCGLFVSIGLGALWVMVDLGIVERERA